MTCDYQLLAEHHAAPHRLQDSRGSGGTVTVLVSALTVRRQQLRPIVTSLLSRQQVGHDIRVSKVSRLDAGEWTFELTQRFPRVRKTNRLGGDLSYKNLRREPAAILTAFISALNQAWTEEGFRDVQPPEPAFTLRVVP